MHKNQFENFYIFIYKYKYTTICTGVCNYIAFQYTTPQTLHYKYLLQKYHLTKQTTSDVNESGNLVLPVK